MFQIVAVPFDAYQALPRPEHRWLLTCLARYVDRTGKAFPSMRQLARDARLSLASVSRYLAAMAELGVFQRQRRPGGRYCYVLAEAYRPRWPGRVSASERGVPQAETPEQVKPAKHPEKKRYAEQKTLPGDLFDDDAKWAARIRSWRKSRFWLAWWGPRPSEPGCWAPTALLRDMG